MSNMLAQSRMTAAAVPVAAAAVVVALIGAATSAWARGTNQEDRASAICLGLAIVLITVAGAVLALARPANSVGWVMAASGALWGLGEALFDLGIRGVLTAPGSIPAANWLTWSGASLRAGGWLAAAIAIPVIFPDGRLPGPRWRWLGWTLVAAVLASALGTALDAHVEYAALARAGWHNPVPLPRAVNVAGDAMASLSLPLMLATIVGSVVAIVVRWRRGDTDRRRQLLTFMLAAALPLVVIPTAFGAGWPAWVFGLSVLPLPIAVAVAILTGGVFDLPTVANRSLVWGTLSAAIVGIYVLIIAGAGTLLGGGGQRWLPWLGTAVVAVTFAPLCQALQTAADRITFGWWRTPYAVLAGLGPRIVTADDAGAALDQIVADLHGRLGLRSVALRDADGVVVAGAPEAKPVVLPLRAYGRVAGELLYGDPVSPLRRADRAVLADLAAQLAILMHARALTMDLRIARERLVLSREEERRRLRRDLHDGLGAALAGLMLKVENVRALMRDDPNAAERDMLAVRQDIASTVGDVRTLVEGLRPPAIDELGLPAALTQAVRRLTAHRSAQVSIDCPESLGAVPAAVEVAIYRIVGEAVTNAIKHAHAAACRVTIARSAGFLTAEIVDTGPGLAGSTIADTASVGGNGLVTMRERAEELGGTLTLSSGPTGVSVRVSLPVPGDGSKPEPGAAPRRVPDEARDPMLMGGGL